MKNFLLKIIFLFVVFCFLFTVFGCVPINSESGNQNPECSVSLPCENGFTCINSFCEVDDSTGGNGNSNQEKFPIRGITLRLHKGDMSQELLDWIRTDLKETGINVVIWRIGYFHYNYTSHPEVATGNRINRDDAKQIVAACKDAGIYCFPGVQFWTHQGGGTAGILNAYPEFDASPGSATKPGIPTPAVGDRAWNPYHPDIRPIVFDLIDELIEDWEVTDFHVGFDEVRIMPHYETSEYAATPYYNGDNYSEIFAYQFKWMHDYLNSKGITMWLWGDRLLSCHDPKWGAWAEDGTRLWPESAICHETDWGKGFNAIHPAIDLISTENVIITDWHYDVNPPTAEHFASKGFDVVSAPLRKLDVAMSMVDRHWNADQDIADKMDGVLQTYWSGADDFMKGFKHGDQVNIPDNISETVCTQNNVCFKAHSALTANTFKAWTNRVKELDPDGPPVYRVNE